MEWVLLKSMGVGGDAFMVAGDQAIVNCCIP